MTRDSDPRDPDSIFGSAAFDDSLFNQSVDPAYATQIYATQIDLGDDDKTIAPQSSEPVAILRIFTNNANPQDIELRPGEITLGRSKKDVDVTLNDKSVSRRHLHLRIEGRQIMATDLGSSSGTFVDGVRIDRPTRLAIGSTVALGEAYVEIRSARTRAVDMTMPPAARAVDMTTPQAARAVDMTTPRAARAADLTTPQAARTRVDLTTPQAPRAPVDLTTPRPRPSEMKAVEPPATLLGKRTQGPFQHPTLLDPSLMASPEVAELIAAPTLEDLQDAARASVLFELEDSERHALLSATERLDVEPGGMLLLPDQPLEYLYIVLNGTLQLQLHGRSVGSVSKGQSIELLGVLGGGRSSVAVRADEPVSLLRISAKTLRDVIARDPKVLRLIVHTHDWPGATRFRQLLRDYGVPRECAVELIAAMNRRTVAAGSRVVAEGSPVTALRIVNRGTLATSKTMDGVPAPLAQLGEGALFGGPELCAARPHALTYDAESEVELLEIDREVAQGQLARSPELANLLEAFGSYGQKKPPPKKPAVAREEEPPDDEDREAPPVETFRKGATRQLKPLRPRFVRQHDEMDCGAACLAMVAQSFGRKLSLASYRSKVHVTREGASMWSLVRAARQSGFEAVGVQCGTNALADLQMPAIALTKYHFVVIFKATKTQVVIGDPGLGIRFLSMAVFAKEFSGSMILLRPTRELWKQPESRPGWRKYLALAPGHVWPLIEIVLASFLGFGLGLVSPLLTQVSFDRVFVHRDAGLLGILTIAMISVTLINTILGAVKSYLLAHLANRFDTMFSALVYRYVMRLPLNFFMVRRVGDILTRFNELRRIRQFITGDALGALISVTSIAIYITALFLYSSMLGYLVLGLIPIVAFTSIASSKRLRRLMEEAFPAQSKAQGQLVEQIRSLETVKSLGAEIAGRWRWEEAFRASFKAGRRIEMLGLVIGAISSLVQQLALVGMMYLATRMAIEGDLTIGKVIAIGMFTSSILGPVGALASQWSGLQGTAVAFGRVDDVLTTGAEPSAEAPPSTATERLKGDIELKNVWFQYGSDLSPWVLKDVNLTIKQGESVAIVGRSGSGKSTLVQLFNLLYRPTRGTITIGGQDITTLNLGELRESIGMVMQDSQLFAGTVFENIAFGQEDASPELVMAAARVANAHGFIAAMRDGYQSRLKEAGGGLSGGQRQRISLARALYRRPTIFVLDEATSALDAESERAVVDAMKVFCRGRTSILIAHRLSTILHADRIVMIENGHVVETGSHRELIAQGGPYAQLFGAQLNL